MIDKIDKVLSVFNSGPVSSVPIEKIPEWAEFCINILGAIANVFIFVCFVAIIGEMIVQAYKSNKMWWFYMFVAIVCLLGADVWTMMYK